MSIKKKFYNVKVRKERYDTNTNNFGGALDKAPPLDQKNQPINLAPYIITLLKAYTMGPPILSCFINVYDLS